MMILYFENLLFVAQFVFVNWRFTAVILKNISFLIEFKKFGRNFNNLWKNKLNKGPKIRKIERRKNIVA